MRHIANVVTPHGVRGFESRPLRQSQPPIRIVAVRLFSVAAIACSLLSGCAAQRSLEVRTDPPGAVVLLDGKEIGTTPLSQPFEHYGVRRITVFKSGFQTHSERVKMKAPWYSRFPLDIVSEVLLPFGWKDRHRLRIELVEGEDLEGMPTLRSVIERANLLRLAGPEGPRPLPSLETTTTGDSGDPGDTPRPPADRGSGGPR